MAPKDLYRLLGVPSYASQERIRTAYRKMVRRYHPDVYHGDADVAHANFRELTEAYDLLTDPSRRREYDRRREEELAAAEVLDAEQHRRWLHFPPPETSATPTIEGRGGLQTFRKAFRKANEQRLSRQDISRRTKLLLVAGFATFCAVLLLLVAVPVSQPFSFSQAPAPGCGNGGGATYQFLRGDRVTLAWTVLSGNFTNTSTLDVQVTGSAGTVSMESEALPGSSGTYSFVADGNAYQFASCYWGRGSISEVQFSGNFVGPLV
ncbi:MAG: DnaJ domain-containing protein [Euryarchaeota archaeon]|nr:DnaJ domain-containing protein [Euryarchaeota archaeon]MDE1837116.1 DnaJ domain-containing protein [Euryarchaeota archaeon]MDE1879672.1 DnaJ domain-containing protein [Euryarchaeota archaeon]MDE2045198.1 DnaJ domain-containing protein [Thermoplasmata archaeon]